MRDCPPKMTSTIINRIARTGRGGRRSPSRPSSTGDFAFQDEPHKLGQEGATPSPWNHLSTRDSSSSILGTLSPRSAGKRGASRSTHCPNLPNSRAGDHAAGLPLTRRKLRDNPRTSGVSGESRLWSSRLTNRNAPARTGSSAMRLGHHLNAPATYRTPENAIPQPASPV